MIISLLQIVMIAAVAVYLCCWIAGARRRNAKSWNSLLARLQPDWNARELIDLSSSNEGPNTTLVEKWKRIRSAHGLWSMYENAGVMLEMANYAARNSDSVDLELLADLRGDAMQIRVYILKTLAKYAFSAVNDYVCMSALRAESAYAEMELRMNELLEVNAADILPAFVAAM